MSDGSFESLLSTIEDELAFATSHYDDSYLDRRVRSRMRRTDCETYDQYREKVLSDPGEGTALLEALSISVTGFFRNPEVWEGIRDVLQRLTAENESVRVWSAACADGRESYSVSLLAHDDPVIDADVVDVVATDISGPALETARSGVYEATQTTDLDEQLSFLDDYEQYVTAESQTYRLDDEIRRPVSFERHDLINDPPKTGFDLVICRNLFIYIDNAYKQSMLETIGGSIRRDGYLVIGKAETIPPALRSAFTVEDARLRIYRRDPSASADEQPAVDSNGPSSE